MDQVQDKSAELRRGVMVFIALAVLTAVEYAIGSLEGAVILLVGIAIVKAGLVLWYFMHLYRVFRPAEESEGGHQ